MSASETWAPVSGFVGRYEVSDHGRVRSVSRLVYSPRHNGYRRISSRVLATHTWGAKYPGIVLHDEDGNATRKMLHVLVAETFVPNSLGLSVVNHIDADTFNCRAENLEWCSYSENLAHAYKIGRRPVGSAHHFAKLPRDKRGRCVSAYGEG